MVLFFRRAANAVKALRPGGRFALCSIAGAIVAGVFLLIFLPRETGSSGLEPMVLKSHAADAAAADARMLQLATPTPSPTPVPTPTPDPTLQVGVMDSERVEELQRQLMTLGYMDFDEPTRHYGPATKYAVELFQRQHGLQQDGIAGPQTLEMIFSGDVKKYTMVEALQGNDVTAFQEQLKELGYLNKVTGYYGTETVASVKEFQKQNGLSQDGKAGEKTLDMINSDKAKASPTVVKAARTKANVEKMITTAKAQVGKKYVLGKTGPDSFDCSGLVYYCLKTAGSNRRRLTAAGYSQVSDWEKISFSGMKRGDLVFFYNDAKTKVGHVGIYLGGGEMIDASSGNGKVVRRSASTSYWKSHFVCARRPW
jgi:cell wall-associated NlpC family hydrolase